MTQAEFEDALEKNHRRIVEITKAIPTATDAEIEPLLTEFLCCKYFLEPEELTTDNLLARIQHCENGWLCQSGD